MWNLFQQLAQEIFILTGSGIHKITSVYLVITVDADKMDMVLDPKNGAMPNARQLLQDFSQQNQPIQSATCQLRWAQIDVQMQPTAMLTITM